MSESGICKIKPEFVIEEHKVKVTLECVSEKDKKLLKDDGDKDEEPVQKKQRLSKKEKKKLKGQNKARGPTYIRELSKELCNSLINVENVDGIKKCEKKNCFFMHDIKEYLKLKSDDISDKCYNYITSGKCNRGLACRFAKSHTTEDGLNKIDHDKHNSYEKTGPHTLNNFDIDVQWKLKKRNYNFDLSERLVKFIDKLRKEDVNCKMKMEIVHEKPNTKDLDDTLTKEDVNEPLSKDINGKLAKEDIDDNIKMKDVELMKTGGVVTDEDLIKLRQREKPVINWKNKLCLSPLTTVGNLPFRRICKEFGVDVTCGEMAMCSSLLQGAPQEWALVKRHHTENIFGVQLCANNPYLLTKCGELLNREANVDFVDLNLGCPIELVYRSGAGSGLLNRPRILESCIRNLSCMLDVPLTVKTRTGVYSNENVAHTFIPKFKDWGAQLVTLHGRSREQRYTRSADWAYIGKCAQEVAPFPILGNGDILSYEDYKTVLNTYPELHGVMIGRGALIKPWIFTEIRNGQLWDIRSNERFDILKKYTNYGLEHWGSDNKGVENTRRFMLEWLSFLYRYIPVGLLETPPQKINERPPFYKGRDDLETLMASPSATDWIKITEMLLGPVPDNFHFLPKHKANSYR